MGEFYLTGVCEVRVQILIKGIDGDTSGKINWVNYKVLEC